MTDSTFVVFQDNLSGLTEMPALRADTLDEAIQNITEGCGASTPSQNYMYFIYKLHEAKVPLFWTHFNFYKFQKSVSGSKVGAARARAGASQGLLYALTHQTSMAWFFTDKPFE